MLQNNLTAMGIKGGNNPFQVDYFLSLIAKSDKIIARISSNMTKISR